MCSRFQRSPLQSGFCAQYLTASLLLLLPHGEHVLSHFQAPNAAWILFLSTQWSLAQCISFLLLLDRILSRYDFCLQLPTLFSSPCHAHTHDTAQTPPSQHGQDDDTYDLPSGPVPGPGPLGSALMVDNPPSTCLCKPQAQGSSCVH